LAGSRGNDAEKIKNHWSTEFTDLLINFNETATNGLAGYNKERHSLFRDTVESGKGFCVTMLGHVTVSQDQKSLQTVVNTD
jgi:hypothetical protein